MINLSHINLSSIHLGGQDLSGIRLGYPSLGYSRENFDPASFDEAWTVTGKTNEDADRATIKNLTGNGKGLVLSNFAFAENSGYNSDGYLVTDGVDDRIISGNFELGENWTMVGDWKFVDGKNVAAGIVKPSSLYIYDRINGLMVYINSDNAPKEIASIKSLKAVCSDGGCYDSNWNEIFVKPGIIKRSGGAIHIGVQGSKFAQVAFKNLAFYKDRILTKEECNRAYNYLQTLKAK